MNFLKSIWNAIKTVATLVYSVTIEPIVALKDIASETFGIAVFKVVDAASRIILIGSLFFAVPSFLVSMAWAWIVFTMIFAVGYIIFVLVVASKGAELMADAFENGAAPEAAAA